MDIRVDVIQSTTDIPKCMSILQIQQTTAQDVHLQCLKYILVTGMLSTKDQLHINIRPYWSYKDDLTVIDDVFMKDRCIVIPQDLKQQALEQLLVNHMGIEKTKPLMSESVYWVNINNDIENHVKTLACALSSSRCSQRRR